jgi:hypothetical protein
MNFLSIRSFRSLAAALAFTLTAAVPAMHAQSAFPDVAQANVPFTFQIDSARFDAGKYMISTLHTGLLQVRGNSGSGFLMSREEIGNKPSTKSFLIFHKYGDKYFLAEIHTKGSANYIECLKTNAEARARKTYLALNPTQGSGVEAAPVDTLR